MEAVQAADILAVRACLAAEAGSVGGQGLRKLVVLEYDVTENVGDGHLGGRDHVEIIEVGVIHLAFLVGKLAGTEARCGIDHHRRLDLFVSVGGVDIEEEIDECPLELGSLALVDGESGSGNLHSEVEVDDIVFLAELPVRKGVLRKLDFRTAHLDDEIVLGALSFGDKVAGDIGQQDDLGVQLLRHFVGLLEEAAGTGLQLGDSCLGSLGLGLQALLHELADLAGLDPLLCQDGIALGLEGAAAGIQLKHALHDLARIEILDGKLRDHFIGIVAEHLKCQHIFVV